MIRKKYFTALTVFLTVLSVVGLGSAIYQYNMSKKYKAVINHNYNRCISEVADAVKNIEYSLEKGLITTSPAAMVKLSNEINRYSNAAMANLGQLPLSNIQIDNTEKFLSQVGDFSNYLAMEYSAGKTVSPEDYSSLENLVSYGKKLEKGFEEITKNLYDGNLSVERLEKEIKKKENVFLDDSISATEEEFVNYPSLIYDGPYSSHIDTIEYSALEGLQEVSESRARQVLREFMGSDKYIIKSLGEKGGRLPSYMYEVYNGKPEGKNYISAEVTKNGGKISWFLNNYNPKSTEISVEKAIENANNFLRVHGYENMQENYYDCSGNIATINFAYTQNGITMYPDLIKVKIAMDTGECIGLEAGGFLLNNKDRSDISPAISEEEALKSVSPNAEIKSSKLAVIPTDSHREILCYEFGGTIKESGRNYLIYINALTGEQEQILILIESENGILTI